MERPLVIKQKTGNSILYCFGALIMALLSLWLVFTDLNSSGGWLKILTQNVVSYALLKILFGVGFLFFGYGFFYLLKRTISRKDILVIDDAGITDHSSAYSFGFIPWEDIKNIYIDSVMSNEFIEVELYNKENYINKLTGLKKRALLANKNMGHQIVCITLHATGVSPDDLLPEIQARFKKAMQRKAQCNH